ncbi:unnamed protein product [Brassicogethes aeneus]|uniref:Regulatory protein zeste n=1 Tax=Brassicogethes aeneus TaxID=1431903 RepID=A0A9P0FKF1_BRAAE|nr:unnamed protein product [Brassicogethes aeneus]
MEAGTSAVKIVKIVNVAPVFGAKVTNMNIDDRKAEKRHIEPEVSEAESEIEDDFILFNKPVPFSQLLKKQTKNNKFEVLGGNPDNQNPSTSNDNNDNNVKECKKSGAVTWKQKEDAWKKIEGEFNSGVKSTSYKNMKNLKVKYNNLKKKTKQKYSQNKRCTLQTGGGSFDTKTILFTDVDETIKSIIGPQITGIQNEYDSDNVMNVDNDDGDDNADGNANADGNGNANSGDNAENIDYNNIIIEEIVEENASLLDADPSGTNVEDDPAAAGNNWTHYSSAKLKMPVSTKLQFKTQKTGIRRKGPLLVHKKSVNKKYVHVSQKLIEEKISLVKLQKEKLMEEHLLKMYILKKKQELIEKKLKQYSERCTNFKRSSNDGQVRKEDLQILQNESMDINEFLDTNFGELEELPVENKEPSNTHPWKSIDVIIPAKEQGNAELPKLQNNKPSTSRAESPAQLRQQNGLLLQQINPKRRKSCLKNVTEQYLSNLNKYLVKQTSTSVDDGFRNGLGQLVTAIRNKRRRKRAKQKIIELAATFDSTSKSSE